MVEKIIETNVSTGSPDETAVTAFKSSLCGNLIRPGSGNRETSLSDFPRVHH